MSQMNVAEFTSRCLHSATQAHLFHFKTMSYVRHVVFEVYYIEIVDLVDVFMETYQGDNAVIESYPWRFSPLPDSPAKLLDELYAWIDENRHDLTSESHLQNIIDEIVSLIDRTRYKLNRLK